LNPNFASGLAAIVVRNFGFAALVIETQMAAIARPPLSVHATNPRLFHDAVHADDKILLISGAGTE
jgi:hypothetical protein